MSDPGVLPAAPVEESTDARPVPEKKAVGYKSLIEVNARHLPADPASQAPAEESSEQPAKGNRFLRAVGKIFHPGAKKETAPSLLEPKQEPPLY